MHTTPPHDEFARFRHNPYPWYAHLRDHDPLHWSTLANGAPVLMVTRYQDVLAILKDARFGKDIFQARHMPWWQRYFFGRINASNMLKSDPPTHTRLRRMASGVFQPRQIAQLRPHITQIAHQLIDRVVAQGEMDFIRDFALPLPITVITEMLAVPSRDHALFHQWSHAIINSGILSGERLWAGREVLQLSAYVRRLIAQCRRHPGDDVISRLIAAEYDGTRLSQLELVTTTILLLIAGHETTVNLLGNGMLALLQHPEQ
ncbi:MAG: cytochrome P450, partial [Roseiflexaceae bacterium]